MNTKILLRKECADDDEIVAMGKHFTVVTSRVEACHGDLVVPRYTALPYYRELETDIRLLGASLINTYQEHRYVADVRNWYPDFIDLTPETWFRLEDVPPTDSGSFVVKGETNSRKTLWKTHMFAKTRADVMPVALRLMDDSLIGSQNLVVRRFETFRSYGEGLNGLPITDEWRWFFLDGEPLAGGFYWSEHADMLTESDIALEPVPMAFARNVGKRLAGKIRFAVADMARRIDGTLRVVELNDGQQSGLSCVDPEVLYAALASRLTGKGRGDK